MSMREVERLLTSKLRNRFSIINFITQRCQGVRDGEHEGQDKEQDATYMCLWAVNGTDGLVTCIPLAIA
jgi:hypothetical protein